MFNLFKEKTKTSLPRIYTNEDPMVMMHVVGKEILDLQKYIDTCNNKDLGRKYIIEIKYKISKLKPLLYAILIEHSGRFKDSVNIVTVQGKDYLSMIPHYRFTIKNIVIYVRKSGFGDPILYKISDDDILDKADISIRRGISMAGFTILSEDRDDISLLQMIGDYQEITRQNIKQFKAARIKDEQLRQRNKVMNMEFGDENQ